MPFTADDVVTALNNANARLTAAGLPAFDQKGLEDFLARSMAQMLAVGADAAAAKAGADAMAATQAAQAVVQQRTQQANEIRAKLTTV